MTDVDFFVRDTDAIKKELLKTQEKNGMYPPRIHAVIGRSSLARSMLAKFQFRGATEDLEFDVFLTSPPSSPIRTAGLHMYTPHQKFMHTYIFDH